MKTNKQANVIFHGEALIFESNLPKGAKQIHPKGNLIIADSETTGNDHVVVNKRGVNFFEFEGTRFMQNTEPTEVKCVLEERHDAVTIEPGTWEFDIAQEYDYYEQSHRKVAD